MQTAVRFLQAHRAACGPRFLALLLWSAALLTGATPASAVTYSYIDLGEGAAYGINNAGQIVGFSSRIGFHARLWDSLVKVNLGAPDGTESAAYGINSSGQAAGRIYTENYGPGTATVWNGTTPTSLGTLGGLPNYAFGINNAGQVVGSIQTEASNNGFQQAALWTGTTPTLLDPLPGGLFSRAVSINSLGQAVGFSSRSSPSAPPHAVLWNGTTATDLGTLGGSFSMAAGINDAGQIVGRSNRAGEDAWHAAVWNGNSVTDLGTLGTGRYSQAAGINSIGQIVGSSDTVGDNERHAVLWNGLVATDLNAFVEPAVTADGWVLQEATAINDSGSIVGLAYNSLNGETHAYVLVAIPEPASCALLLAGLGLLACSARLGRARGRRAQAWRRRARKGSAGPAPYLAASSASISSMMVSMRLMRA